MPASSPGSTPWVIVGDLVRSRHVPDRAALGRRLEAALHALHVKHDDERGWMAPLMTTRGIDEVSGVLHAPDDLFDIATTLNIHLWPQRFRFAVSTGTIDIHPDTTIAADMDGPAFHQAATGMERARNEEIGFAVELPEESRAVCGVVEQLAHLHATLMASWTERETEIVRRYRSLGRQVAVAKKLDISQQAVSYALKRAHERDMTQAESAIRTWLTTLPS